MRIPLSESIIRLSVLLSHVLIWISSRQVRRDANSERKEDLLKIFKTKTEECLMRRNLF